MNCEGNKEYSVNWKNHMSHVRKAFDHLLNSNELTDVTLCCEGRKIGAHKMLLSACSAYFRDTFKEVPCQHPVIILYGVEYSVLSDILHFIYNGEVSVDTSKLDSFLKIAQLLQISGLTDDPSDKQNVENDDNEQMKQVIQGVAEPAVQATNISLAPTEQPRTSVKRVRVKDTEPIREKLQRHEDETVFVSDIKCEPSEIVNFESSLEDPLQPDQSNEGKEFFGTSTDQNIEEDEFKKSQAECSSSGMQDLLKRNAAWILRNESSIRTSEAPPTKEMKHELVKTQEKCPRNRKRRKRCLGCYERITAEKGSKEASKITKKVSTYCCMCTNKPFLCISCFSQHSSY